MVSCFMAGEIAIHPTLSCSPLPPTVHLIGESKSSLEDTHDKGQLGPCTENKTQSIGSAENNCYSTGPNTVVKSAIN